MKVQLLTAAVLSLGMVVGTASLAQSAGTNSRTARPAHTTVLPKQPVSHSVTSSITMQKPCGGNYSMIRQANGTCRHIGAT